MPFTKKALIRDHMNPGPSPMHIVCVCGTHVRVLEPFDPDYTVRCPDCRTAYDGAGWIQDEGPQGNC